MYTVRKTVAAGAAGGFATTANAIPPFVGAPDWGLTEEEQRNQAKLAQQAADCYTAKGRAREPSRRPAGRSRR